MGRASQRRMVLLGLVLSLALSASACKTVKPWERDVLARPDMSFDSGIEGEMRSGVFFSKEASLPGGGAGGGGCGCN